VAYFLNRVFPFLNLKNIAVVSLFRSTRAPRACPAFCSVP
jgi:hypothetical protein